jgi:hypothetical protein
MKSLQDLKDDLGDLGLVDSDFLDVFELIRVKLVGDSRVLFDSRKTSFLSTIVKDVKFFTSKKAKVVKQFSGLKMKNKDRHVKEQIKTVVKIKNLNNELRMVSEKLSNPRNMRVKDDVERVKSLKASIKGYKFKRMRQVNSEIADSVDRRRKNNWSRTVSEEKRYRELLKLQESLIGQFYARRSRKRRRRKDGLDKAYLRRQALRHPDSDIVQSKPNFSHYIYEEVVGADGDVYVFRDPVFHDDIYNPDSPPGLSDLDGGSEFSY